MESNLTSFLDFSSAGGETLALTCDLLSISRSIYSTALIVTDKVSGFAYNIFGAIGGLFIIVNASRLLKKSIIKLQNAKTLEMKIFHATINVHGNLQYLILGISLLAFKVSSAVRPALFCTSVFFNMFMGSYLALSALMLIRAVYGLGITYSLKAVLDTEKTSEVFSDKPFVPEYENGTVETNLTTEKDPNTLIKTKVAKLKELAQLDPEKFDMQTKEGLAAKVIAFDPLDSLEACEKLLDEVKKANYDANTDFWMLLGIASASVTAASLGLVFTGPIAEILINLISMIGSVGWVTADATELRNAIKDWFWQHHVKSEKGEYSKLEQAEFWTKTAVGLITAPVWIVPALAYHKISTLGSNLERACPI